jgi:hypothetical protein
VCALPLLLRSSSGMASLTAIRRPGASLNPFHEPAHFGWCPADL